MKSCRTALTLYRRQTFCKAWSYWQNQRPRCVTARSAYCGVSTSSHNMIVSGESWNGLVSIQCENFDTEAVDGVSVATCQWKGQTITYSPILACTKRTPAAFECAVVSTALVLERPIGKILRLLEEATKIKVGDEGCPLHARLGLISTIGWVEVRDLPGIQHAADGMSQ
jgi:hypothetical protein